MALTFYPESTTPLPSDLPNRSLIKIVSLLGGGGAGGGTLTGVVNPGGVVTGSLGSIYTNTANNTVWINNNGGTGWTQFGSGSGIGTLTGAGNPNGVTAGSLGQVYIRTSDNTIWVNTDGVTAWTQSGGAPEILTYPTTDPNTDGITPTNQNAPALAYSATGIGAAYYWRTDTHVWI